MAQRLDFETELRGNSAVCYVEPLQTDPIDVWSSAGVGTLRRLAMGDSGRRGHSDRELFPPFRPDSMRKTGHVPRRKYFPSEISLHEKY